MRPIYLQLVDARYFIAVQREDDAHALMQVHAVAYEPVELGEEGVERAVALAGDGQRDALEEAVAVAIEFHLAGFLLGRFED